MGAKILQLQKTLDDAAASVKTARRALAAASGPAEIKAATKQVETALVAKIAAQAAVDAAKPEGKTTTVKHLKHEEKVTVKDEGDDEEAEEATPPPDSAVSSTPASEVESTGADAAEVADEKALVVAYDKAEKAFHKAVAESPNAQALALHSPARLRRIASQVTGQKGVREVMGALDGIGQKLAAAEKVTARVEKLEQRDRGTRVDAMVAKAQAEGKLVGKERLAAVKADGRQHGTKWLEGHLATLPKIVRTLEDGAFVPRQDSDGNAVGTLTADQQKILMDATAGMSAADAEKFRATVVANAQKSGKSAAPTH